MGKSPEVLAHPRSASENVSGGCQVGRPRFFSGETEAFLWWLPRDFWGEFDYRCLEDFFFDFRVACVFLQILRVGNGWIWVSQIQKVQSPQNDNWELY